MEQLNEVHVRQAGMRAAFDGAMLARGPAEEETVCEGRAAEGGQRICFTYLVTMLSSSVQAAIATPGVCLEGPSPPWKMVGKSNAVGAHSLGRTRRRYVVTLVEKLMGATMGTEASMRAGAYGREGFEAETNDVPYIMYAEFCRSVQAAQGGYARGGPG